MGVGVLGHGHCGYISTVVVTTTGDAMEEKAGIRELKARLSSYIRRVKSGATVLITDRGEPVARLMPVATRPVERMVALEEAGLVAWSGRGLRSLEPVARAAGGRDVASLLVEDRG